jgi:hypothetical protein
LGMLKCLFIIAHKTSSSTKIQARAEMSFSRRYGEPDWTQRPFDNLTTPCFHALQHIEHTNESYEEWRLNFLSSVAVTPSSSGLSFCAKRQIRPSQPCVPSKPLIAMSTTPAVTQDADSDSESDEGELPHKLVKSQLESVSAHLRPVDCERDADISHRDAGCSGLEHILILPSNAKA